MLSLPNNINGLFCRWRIHYANALNKQWRDVASVACERHDDQAFQPIFAGVSWYQQPLSVYRNHASL